MLTPQQVTAARERLGIMPESTKTSGSDLQSAWDSYDKEKGVTQQKQHEDHATKADKATFPATGDESVMGIAGKTIGNIPASAGHFAKGVFDFLNPLTAYNAAKDLGTSLGDATQPKVSALDVAKEIPHEAYKAVVPQFLQHIFSGNLKEAAATIENDPVGQIAPLLMVARGAAEKAGKVAEFDSAMSKIASPATKLGGKMAEVAGKTTSQILGATTGTGASTIKAAAEGTPAFTDAMRGKTSADDVVRSAESVVQNVKNQRATTYQNDLKNIGEDKTSHDISNVHKEIDTQLNNFGVKVKDDGSLDFSRSSIANNGAARNDIQGVYETLKDWGTKKGDRTGVGLDTLKRQLGDFYSESGQARSFVQAIKSKVSDVLKTNVPGYKEMTAKYAKASDLLDDIKSSTGVGGKAKADTVFTKLTSAMKGDKEFRLEVLKQMEAAGEPNLMDKIAGTNMQSIVPKGLVGRGIDVVTAYQLLQGVFSAKFIPMLVATSPRIMGEFVRALGLGATKASKVMEAVNKVAPFSLDVAPGAATVNNQEQEQPPKP